MGAPPNTARTPQRRGSRLRRAAGLHGLLPTAIVVVVTGIAFWSIRLAQAPPRDSVPFRIGFQQSPPYQVVTAAGTPEGPAIDVVSEAARRRGIPLQWVPAPAGPDASLPPGKVDLWPLVGDLPERRRHYHISPPWMNISFWLVSKESAGITDPKDTIGRSVGHYRMDITSRLARAYFPGARLVPYPTSAKVMDAVCSGEVPVSRVPCRFIGDTGRIRQVLTNLIGNAVKFTPSGSVLVSVECEGQSASAAQVRISVRDTGVGIPQNKLDLLFEKFSQVDGSITRKYGGTGLGLAICRELIGLMGGTIQVESRAGEGSTFRFTLPLRLDAQWHAASAPAIDLRGLPVLIVDDNEVNRRVVHEQVICRWVPPPRVGCATAK